MTAWPNATQDWLNVSNGEYVLPACLIPSQLVEYKPDQLCYLFRKLCFMQGEQIHEGWGRLPWGADKSAVGAINRPLQVTPFIKH